jgi:hypothetical protein
MTTLTFAPQYKLLNLSPFKFSLCSLILSIFKNNSLRTKYPIHPITDIINNLINDFDCEISKNNFFKKLFFECQKNFGQTYIDPESLYADLTSIIESAFNSIKNMNDLYMFYNLSIRELKSNYDNNVPLLENGGFADNFIRKCLFAFYKLTFEQLYKLITDIHKYTNNEDIKLNLTQRESELLFEKQINNITYKLTNSEKRMIDDSLLTSINYKHKYFFANDVDSIHKFFDCNLKYFYDGGKETTHNKIHYALLNLVDYYFSNSYYDEALQSKFIII